MEFCCILTGISPQPLGDIQMSTVQFILLVVFVLVAIKGWREFLALVFLVGLCALVFNGHGIEALLSVIVVLLLVGLSKK